MRFLAENEDTELGEGFLELLWDWAVDEKISGEVDHDQQVGYGLHAHDPQGWDIPFNILDAINLIIWKEADEDGDSQ